MNNIVGVLAVGLGLTSVANCRPVAKRERRRVERMQPGIVRIAAPNEASVALFGLMIVGLGLVLLFSAV